MVTQKQRRLWAFLAALACVMWGISGLFAKSLFNVSSELRRCGFHKSEWSYLALSC